MSRQQRPSRAVRRASFRGTAKLNDGATQLLTGGSLILAIGLAAMLLLFTLFGGVGVEGAHSNMGWLALIIGMMCLPFGAMLAALGLAKWLRNVGQRKRR